MEELASELKTQAKETVMDRMMEVKVKVDAPRGWTLLGAIIGASVGGLLMKKAYAKPLMLVLGGMALGVFASMLSPVTSRERQPDTSGTSMGKGRSYQGDVGAMRSSTLGAMDRSEDLMGAERPSLDGSDRADTLASPIGSRIPPVPPLDDLSTKIH